MYGYGDNSNGGSVGNSGGVGAELDREDSGARPLGASIRSSVTI